MVRKIRKGEARRGLILANGGLATYQYAVCVSSSARKGPYPDKNPLPELLLDVAAPPVDPHAEGEATIEVSFVRYSRQ